MRFPNFPSLVAAATCVIVSSPVRAQQNLSAPRGWSKSTTGNNVVFTQIKSGSRIIVKPLSPLNGDLRSWFSRQLALDAKVRGALETSEPIQSQGAALTQLRTFDAAEEARVVIYVGYPVGKQARLMLASGPSRLAVAQAMQEANALGEQIGALDAATARRSANAGGSKKVSGSKKATPKTKIASSGAQPKLAPISAKGTLKSSQILGVYLNEGYTTGVGGMMIIEYTPVLLLRDGSARRDLEVPPLDLNLQSDKKAHFADWGKWRRSGDKFVVRWPKGDSDELRASHKTRAAKPGQTLARSYSTIGGGGNTALGGNVMISYSNQYNFARNGTFTTDSSGGGSTENVTAYSKSKTAGRYRLDGNALTLRYNDGRTVRRFFYFYDQKDEDVIGIGDSAYIGEK